jgi:hypothetical protein
MTDVGEEAARSLRSVSELRTRTRLARDGHWFVLLVFGVVVLGSIPFYVETFLTASSPGCQAVNGGVSCVYRPYHPVLGGAFNSMWALNGLGRWATLYWAPAIVIGFAVVVAYYRRRAAVVGVQGRIWPAVVVGVGLLVLVLAVDRRTSPFPPIPDLWLRGTGALLIIALGIAALAMLERSRAFGLYAVGFCGLALLSCLYDDSNLFDRFGIGNPFLGGGEEVPNLLLPGLYLLLGGIGFWLGNRHRRQRVAASGTT